MEKPSTSELFNKMFREFFDVYPYKTQKSIYVFISIVDNDRYDVLYVDTATHNVQALTHVTKTMIKSFLEAKPLLAGHIVITVFKSGDGLEVERYFEMYAPFLHDIMAFIDSI
ncbi:hypothetical protein [Thermofilum sp.]|jgi:hypothetical protein|uniref:hypothetical protein n=1 Tax=Thermofilum sp. TaxID=1961369 RepID=UPI0025884D00|nr:hypothetical protein [Thermofilum sp.]